MGSDTEKKSQIELTWKRNCLILVVGVLAIGLGTIVLGLGESAVVNSENDDVLVVVEGDPKKSIALITSAISRRGGEYGEFKSSFVHAVSMDNKARYCKERGWSLIVGGDTPEAKERSARWNKVAWLRRLLPRYEWLIWMDLDTLFTSADEDMLDVLINNALRTNNKKKFFLNMRQPTIQVHLTLDSTSSLESFDTRNKVNTGILAMRRSAWTERFLSKVWDHNDGGTGQSDQNSFNHIYHNLLESNQAIPIYVHPKWRLNAFPDVSNYIPTDGYERAPPGDERQNGGTLIVHFAGQYAGARAIDGNIPPTMLVQFLDLLLQRHAQFLSTLDASSTQLNFVNTARETLEPCINTIRTFYTKQEQDIESGAIYFTPSSQEEACDAAKTLRDVRPKLVQLLPTAVQPLRCVRPDPPIFTKEASTHNVASLIDQGFSKNLRLFAQIDIPIKWSTSKRAFSASFGMALVALDCAWLVSTSSVFAISSQSDVLDIGSGVSSDEIARNRNRGELKQDVVGRRNLLRSKKTPELGTAVVLGPLPSRRQLYKSDEFPTKQIIASKDDEIFAASYFWRFLGPLALTCLAKAPESARLVILASAEDEFAPFASSDDDWRSIGITRKPEFLFVPTTKSITHLAYADEMLACQFYENRPNGASTIWSQHRRDLIKIATAGLGRSGQALQRHHEFEHFDTDIPTIAVVCGAPGGFQDCATTLAAVKSAAGSIPIRLSTTHSIHGQSDEPAWHALSKRRFLPPSVDIVLFPRTSERFDVAPLLATPCFDRGTTFIQIANSPTTPGYSFTQAAADALKLKLVVLALKDKHRRGPGLIPSDLSTLLAKPLSSILESAAKRKTDAPLALEQDDDINVQTDTNAHLLS